MPYIKLNTTAEVGEEKAEALKAKFGKAIECFPGKTEQWLMVGIEDRQRLWFRGDNSRDLAILDVELLGRLPEDASARMTAAICRILEEELNIAPDCVYVKYSGYANWGWNGGNF